MDHRPGGFHHRVLLVVVDQLGEGVELLPAADVVLVPCAPDHHVGHLSSGGHVKQILAFSMQFNGHLVFAANREDVVARVALGLAD